MRVNLLRSILLTATLAFFGCDIQDMVASASFKEDFEYTYKFAPGGRLSVESYNGSIEIVAWDQDEVRITGVKYASSESLLAAVKIDVVATDDFIQVRTVRPSGRRGNMGAKYVIHAPKRVELDRITSSNGAIRVDGTEGNARMKTSNGKIGVAGLLGNIDATSSNGSIELGETEGDATLKTSNGSIKASVVGGRLDAKTSNGSINIRLLGDGGGRPIEAHSSNGGITLTLEKQPTADVIVTTSNSNITLRAPASLSATLQADTSNASIKTDFEVTVQGTQKKNRLHGAINGGGPRIELDTSNGGIRIEKLAGEA